MLCSSHSNFDAVDAIQNGRYGVFLTVRTGCRVYNPGNNF